MNRHLLRKNSATALFLWLTVVHTPSTFAGEHYLQKDEFDGSTEIFFRSTTDETIKAKFLMALTNFSPKEKTMQLIIKGPFGVDCDNRGLEIKTKDGVIHKTEAVEQDFIYCYANVQVDWVTKKFTVRLPMRGAPSLIGVMDTTSMRPNLYKLEK